MKPDFASKTARKTTCQPRPKWYTAKIVRGRHLTYRRNSTTAGVFGVAVATEGGKQWTQYIGEADDVREADGIEVFNHRQALNRANELADAYKPTGKVHARPVTIDEALTGYADELRATGGKLTNVSDVRRYLGKNNPLLSTPLATIAKSHLLAWRKTLSAKPVARSTLNRVMSSAKSAFNLAAESDPAIAANALAWKHGLKRFHEIDTKPRDYSHITQDDIARLVTAAYELSPAFGLYIHVLAQTGSRPSQVARLTVGAIQPKRVMMPRSSKGSNIKKAKGSKEPIPVPMHRDVIAKLQAAAAGKGRNELALLQPSGKSWNNSEEAKTLFKKAVKAAGIRAIDGHAVGRYVFRYFSITQMLLAHNPNELVARVHDTSVKVLHEHYAAFMHNNYDDQLVSHVPNFAAPKVVPLAA